MKYTLEQAGFPSNKNVRHYRPGASRRQRQQRGGTVRFHGSQEN
jgi:hypothetical protein